MAKKITFNALTGEVTESEYSPIKEPIIEPIEPSAEDRIKALEDAILILMG